MGEMMKNGLEAAAQRPLRQLGRRRAGAARLDRVGRGSDDRAEGEGGGLHQPRRRRRRVELRRQRGALADAVRPRAGAVDPAATARQERSTTAGSSGRASRRRPRDGQPMLKAPPVGALGSGSDYTAFLDHVGIASMDMGLNGRGGDGSYHSTYDNPTWFKKYIDPQFTFSVLAAQVTGVALLRLADAEVLPFDYETLRPADSRVHRRDRAAGDQGVGGRREEDRFRRPAIRGGGVREGRRAMSRAARRALARRHGRRRSAISPTMNRRLIMAERDLIEPAGLARSAVVPPRDLRARPVHRLRREDDSGRARSRGRRQLRARGGAGGDRHPRAAARDEDAQGT